MGSHVIGLLVIILVIVGSISLGGRFILFFNIPSLIIVFGITFGGIIYRFGFNWVTYMNSSAQARQNLCRYGKFLSLVAGGMGVIIAFVQVFANFKEVSSLGPAISICFVCSFYGLILALIFHLLEKYDDSNEGIDADY